MSGAGVDDLIDELFSEKAGKNQLPTSAAAAPRQHARQQSEWDDDSEDERVVASNTRVSGVGVSRLPAYINNPAAAGALHTGGHLFDSDSSEDETDKTNCKENGVGSSTNAPGRISALACDSSTSTLNNNSQGDVPALRRGMSCAVIHPVPFPSLADSEGSFSCAPRCYLTNRGAVLRGSGSHPTLLHLRELAANERSTACCTRAQVMFKKGALHAVLPRLGNGCLDHHGDCTNDGGCPHILCRKCNYMVVRLQGAEWDDHHGRVNLYLTLRNYYPDWCRLASVTPVGFEDGLGVATAARHVLKVNPAAAAYCCQCSWLTVKSAKAVIETKLTDTFLVKAGSDGSHPFATELPLVAGEKRRPPLWVCHGHPQ